MFTVVRKKSERPHRIFRYSLKVLMLTKRKIVTLLRRMLIEVTQPTMVGQIPCASPGHRRLHTVRNCLSSVIFLPKMEPLNPSSHEETSSNPKVKNIVQNNLSLPFKMSGSG